jgi:hypothetical protein
MITLVKDAHALRLVRTLVKENTFRTYEGVTFPSNPWQGCELHLRRCDFFGWLKSGDSIVVDVLDSNGDVVQDFPITKAGFEYLRGKLKFRVDKG